MSARASRHVHACAVAEGTRALPPQPEIAAALHTVELGAARSFRNVAVFPLLMHEAREADYLTLDDALAEGVVSITEVSQAGSVPELSLLNRGRRPVLLLDGEELVGARQNRVLNLTILAAAQATVVIPVSCVEAGRWSSRSETFAAAPRAQFAEGRAEKMRHVTASMMSAGTRRSNQPEVWRSIREKAERLGARSETEAMADVFEQVGASVDDFVSAFPPDGKQAGAIFAINGRIVGLELFDTPATWRKLSPKLIRSYAIDALDGERVPASPLAAEAQQFMEQLAAAASQPFTATGLGTDVRLSSPSVNGAALVADGRAVHISAFAQA